MRLRVSACVHYIRTHFVPASIVAVPNRGCVIVCGRGGGEERLYIYERNRAEAFINGKVGFRILSAFPSPRLYMCVYVCVTAG